MKNYLTDEECCSNFYKYYKDISSQESIYISEDDKFLKDFSKADEFIWKMTNGLMGDYYMSCCRKYGTVSIIPIREED